MDAFREQGVEPMAIIALLARLGTSDPVEPVTDAMPLIQTIDFARFGRAPARFDEAELAQLNARILHQTGYDSVAARLPDGMDAVAWEAIRPNLNTLADVAEWWGVVKGPIAANLDPADHDFRVQAASIAAKLDWSVDPWHALTDALKAATERKGKALFLPLRQALTGHDHGPDMKALLPLIGQEEAIRRLSV
jgi:glutamyl-tRNA synthetase